MTMGLLLTLTFDSAVNSDGYFLDAFSTFEIALLRGGEITLVYSIQVSGQAVPEHSTILSLAAIGIGFGVSFKHKLAKANNKSNSASQA